MADTEHGSIDWEAIKAEYISTDISYRGLIEKYGIAMATLNRRAKKENWVRLRERYKSKVVAKTLEKAGAKKGEYRQKIYKLADKMVGKLDELIDGRSLEALVNMKIKPSDITGAIRDITQILDVKSESEMREQAARIANLERQAAGEETKEVRVVMADDAEKFAK